MSWRQSELAGRNNPENPKQTDTACTHPWEWYSIDTGFGMWRICPRHKYQPIEDGNIKFNNHEYLQELRQALLNGEKHPGCNDCWKAEAAGGKSYRKAFDANVWPEREVTTVKKRGPKWVEIKFSNLCNIRCLTCHPICSSLWEDAIGMPDDAKQCMNLNAKPADTTKKWFRWFKENYDDIDSIQLFGGEPVLHPDFYPLLDLILNAPKGSSRKQISYSTNGLWSTKFKNKHYKYVQALLDAGHTVFVRFSIDGVGAQGEYIRDNLDWKKFEKNFKEYFETFYGHERVTRMRCNVALSILNILSLDKICQWLDANTPGVIPHYNFVSVPNKFYMLNWGRKLKVFKDIIARQDYGQYDEYKQHVLDMCEGYSNEEPNENAIKELKFFLDDYDLKKGVNHFDIFPLNKLLFHGVDTTPPGTTVVYSDNNRQVIEQNVHGLIQVNGAYFDSRGRETDQNGVKRKDPVTGKDRW